MKIKSVVKVMNFHALLRVDKSRKKAEKYRDLEQQLTEMMSIVFNNRNFILDRKVVTPDKSKPALSIYLGSDLGFCGSVNSSVSRNIKAENSQKIIIGKKVGHGERDDVLLKFSREDYDEYADRLIDILKDAVINRKYSSVTLVYNHYYNISRIELVEKTIFPLDIDFKREKTVKNDYQVESYDGKLFENLIIQYLEFECRIAWLNSFASENILRQSTTQESLKKIDEIEEEELKVERKTRKMKSFKKVLDTYTNSKELKED